MRDLANRMTMHARDDRSSCMRPTRWPPASWLDRLGIFLANAINGPRVGAFSLPGTNSQQNYA